MPKARASPWTLPSESRRSMHAPRRPRTIRTTRAMITTRKTTSSRHLPRARARPRPLSPSDEESVSHKRQSWCEAKPTQSDVDYAANEDSADQDKLVDDIAKSEDMADVQGSPKECVADEDEEEGEDEGEDEDEDEDEEDEEEESKTPPKKAAKALSVDAVQEMPVEQALRLVQTASPAVTTASPRRPAAPTAASGARMGTCPQYGPHFLGHGASRAGITRLSVQYNQQMQELVDVLLQQSEAFHADFVCHFYEDETDCEVLQGILERGLQMSTALSRHQDRYAWHPVSPVVHTPKLPANEPESLYTCLLPPADALLGVLKDIPIVSAIAKVLQHTSLQVSATRAPNTFDSLTKEATLEYLTNVAPSVSGSSSMLAGSLSMAPTSSPTRSLVGPAAPHSTSTAMEGVEGCGL
ncbi:hypothetical protein B0H14DRAFT_2627416 [Mycena olivaceomarginata]|nr:hypothetical protein B0H14DRAFT_2627416 [Mycena olivaceomarginata]